ncbi:PREDICTED: mitochondrial import receptor subunit TOM20 homolog [Nicrophorus vespilloides]|uniref:Mitochondrial import receptor subunit TOM20 homolog n=1 Tax=Nicrophorus vespilloides TaxID=110193 RepID=A0ABM1MQ35_NICVS|nr:PREDICTED: mitochondrial import receptor subunit TOM20 homolog [Nicrophorus vespilloides]
MQMSVIGYVTILCGTSLLAFCLYLDRRRHQDPSFRRRLKERRQKLKKQHLPHYEITPRNIDPRYREAVIIKEIQMAEKLMVQDKLDEAIIHFARAISVCADPEHLMNCLRHTLPANAYDSLIHLLIKLYGEACKVEESEKTRPSKLNSELAASLAF